MERFMDRMEKEAVLLSESPGSALLTKEKFDLIVQHLKQPDTSSSNADAHFRHWVKSKKFSLMNNKPGIIGLIGDVLVVPNKKVKDEGSASSLQVLHADNIVSVLYDIHATEMKHSGYKKVLEYSQRHYQGPTRNYVQKFCSMCPICQLRAPQQIFRRPLSSSKEPMIQNNKDFLDSVQIDLIDMSHSPDGEYHYIGHFMDHFSKFHVLFPLKTNSAPEIVQLLEERVLAYFGPPKNSFHSDIGVESVTQIITMKVKALFESWGGRQVTFVNDKPRYSQSQSQPLVGGLVDRGNRTVERKLAAMNIDEGLHANAIYHPWASWLPRVMFSMNTEVQRTANEPAPYTNEPAPYTNEPAPYTVVFGKSPPSGFLPGASHSHSHPLIKEEDLSEEEEQEEESQSQSQQQRPVVPAPRTTTLTQQQQHDLDPDTESPAPPTDLYPDDDDAALSEEDKNRHTFIARKRRAYYKKTVETAKERMEHFYNKQKRIKTATFSV